MPGSPLRILQLYPKGDFFTGAAIQLRALSAGLVARGHQVTVATPPSDVWPERCRAIDVEHVVVPMARAWDPRAAWRLARVIRDRRIQVAHAHKGRARTLALLAGLMGGRTALVLNRGVSFPVTGLQRLGYTTPRVHAIVAVCESIKRGLTAGGVPAHKVEVIYSGTDLERFHPGVDGAPIRRELRLDRGDELVTQIGVRSWRGWKELIAAMRTVAARRPRGRGWSWARRHRASERSPTMPAPPASATACSRSATVTTCRRSSAPPTSSPMRRGPGWGSPAASARRWPASGRSWRRPSRACRS